MKQPIPKNINKKNKKNNKTIVTKQPYSKKHTHKYGTSKLEIDFAKNFLDANGIKYIYQYEAKEIGRYFDFAVTSYNNKNYIMESKDGIECVKQEGQPFDIAFFIEVDGDYW